MPSFNFEMLKLAREERGLSQKNLAKKLHATQSEISKFEGGEKMPDEDFVKRAASFFGYTAEFFSRPFMALPCGLVFHRKRNALSATDRKRIVAEARARMLDLAVMAKSAGISQNALPRREGRLPENMARLVRDAWGVKPGPVENMSGLLERHRIVVLPFDFGSELLDGFFMPPAEEGSPHCIALNSSDAFPPDRKRFTLAHELGHLMLHRDEFADEDGKRQEDEANAFASEFLMPAEDVDEDFSEPLTFVRLRELKAKWKVSMGALVMRAKSLGAITDAEEKRIWFLFSRYGYRKHEPPMGLVEEKPQGITWLASKFAEAKGAEAPAALFLSSGLFARRYPSAAMSAGISQEAAM